MPNVLDALFSRRSLWVTGKGGVGKSTIAASLALIAADRGMRTLVIDVEGKGDASRFLDAHPPGYTAKRASDNLHHLALQPEEVLDEYLRLGLKLPKVYRMGPVSKIFDFIATAAPGIKEVLIAGKVGFEERAREDGGPRWDLIVVDAAPSGQVLSHLRGPRTLQELVQVGLIRNQTQWVREIIEDPARTAMVVVALAEEMPVTETAELLEEAPTLVPTPVAALVANRVVPPPSHPDVVGAFAANRRQLADALGAPVAPGLDALELFAELSASQAPHLERLHRLGPPVLEVPYLPLGRHDLETSKEVAKALNAAVGETVSGVRG